MKNKILIVDDEEGICEFMQEMFERKGCKVFTASDDQTALGVFEKEKPQVCLLDVHMPFSPFDGVELLKFLKAVEPNTTCVMLSRVDDMRKVEEAKKLGANKYIFKPIADELDDLIKELSG